MKYLYIILLFCLLQNNVFAQNTDLSCPKVEWIKSINTSANHRTNYMKIEENKKGNIVISCSYINNLSIDTFNVGNNTGVETLALMEGDAEGNILWLKSANGNGHTANNRFNKKLVMHHNEINLIMMHNQSTTFNGQNYNSSIINQPLQQLHLNAEYTLIKLDSNNQTINNFSVQNLKLQNVITDSLGFSYVIATYNSTINIANQTFVPLGQHDAIVIKINRQNQVQWVLPISGKGNEEFTNITLDKKLNVYVAGHFNSDTLQIGNEIIIDTARRNVNSYSGNNILFTKISNSGTPIWIKHTNAARNTQARATQLIVDSNDNVYILANLAGKLSLNNTNIESPKARTSNTYIQSATLIRFKPLLNEYTAITLDGSARNFGYDMILHPNDNFIYLVGEYSDTLYTPNRYYKTNNRNGVRGFICRLNIENEKIDIDNIIECENDSNLVYNINSGSDGSIYITGYYQSNMKLLNKNLSNTNNNLTYFYAKISGLNKEITYDGSMYTATETQATTYQWLDCNNNMQAIPGATSRTFTPTSSGSYAVELSNGACQVVSECLGTTSLPKTILAQTQIFPNPFDQSISIQVPPTLAQQELHLQVTDLLGRTIWSHKGNAKELNEKLQTVSQRWPSNQMYQLQITLANTNESATYKIMKQ